MSKGPNRIKGQLCGGGTSLYSQYSEGRDKWIGRFEASLVYIVSPRTARAIEQDYILEKKEGWEEKEQLVLGTQHISC